MPERERLLILTKYKYIKNEQLWYETFFEGI
jgi:hypothetical protein